MRLINALSLGTTANDWLENSHHPRVLHVFDRACNLINERREVLSIVSPQIGNGPFNLVIEEDVGLSEHLTHYSPVFHSSLSLTLGDLLINTPDAKFWDPYPDWEMLYAKKEDIANRLKLVPITRDPPSILQTSNSLLISLAMADIPPSLLAAQKLAGLGPGLTPAGDDFIMGALHATWIIHPPELAGVLAREIADTAAPLTTSLSAAWIRSAGRGEAGILWHTFFDALTSGDEQDIQGAFEQILAVGETSGADALAGFIGMVKCWMKLNVPRASNER